MTQSLLDLRWPKSHFNPNTKAVEHIYLPNRLTLDHIKPFVHYDGGNFFGSFGGFHLKTGFQPIFSLAHRSQVGFEALLRPKTYSGNPVSPLAVFDFAQCMEDSVFLDRLCRLVHTRNFLEQADDDSWLFLNISPKVTEEGGHYGAFFADMLEFCQIDPSRVVIEILEDQIQDEGLLAESVAYYKELGCLIAIDDFGAGYSNFNRLCRILPHIVKLDRSIIAQAVANKTVRRGIVNLVNLIHETGSLALMEGVESEEEALIAMDSDIDFVQGFYFAKPEESLPPKKKGCSVISDLWESYKSVNVFEAQKRDSELKHYREEFKRFAENFSAGMDVHSSCQSFLMLSRAERCYLLDSEGRQIGGFLVSPGLEEESGFFPLPDSGGAFWMRRHYFLRAINNPGKMQSSRPYLSIKGGNMCITLSLTIAKEEETVVLCGDIRWVD